MHMPKSRTKKGNAESEKKAKYSRPLGEEYCSTHERQYASGCLHG
jgi:hypothetical protein